MILKPPKGAMINRGSNFARGLVGCWLMNEGGGNIVNDLSGNGNNLALNSCLWGAGKFGSTVEGDRANSWIENTGIKLPQVGTIIIRARIDTLTLGDTLLQETASGYIDMDIETGYDLRCRFHDGAGFKTEYFDVVAGVTYDFGFSWNASQIKFYWDGVNTATEAFAGLNTSAIGLALLADRVQGSKMDCGIEYVYLFNCALSAPELALLRREPFAMFEQENLPLFVAATSGGGAPPTGNAGIMTPNTGFWGATY